MDIGLHGTTGQIVQLVVETGHDEGPGHAQIRSLIMAVKCVKATTPNTRSVFLSLVEVKFVNAGKITK